MQLQNITTHNSITNTVKYTVYLCLKIMMSTNENKVLLQFLLVMDSRVMDIEKKKFYNLSVLHAAVL